jgi:hypothetical protein
VEQAAAKARVTAAGTASQRATVQAVSFALLAVAAFIAVLLAHGFLPGMLNNASAGYLWEGGIQCLHDLGLDALSSHCHAYGEPLGYPFLTGGPVMVLGAVLMYLPGVESSEAYTLAGAGFDALALAGGYGLMRMLGAGRVIALVTSLVYLVAPTVIGMQGFGGTFTGYTLLPTYAFVDLVVIRTVGRGIVRPIALALVCYAGVKTGALFLDGYSYVASNLVSALLWGAWATHSEARNRGTAIGLAGFAIANVVALAAYAYYVPGTYAQESLSVFRSMGLDAVTLVAPTESVWWSANFGLASDHSALWGDGTNSAYNYAGFASILLAISYVAGRPRERSAIAIGVAGLVALVLALGPSLKVDEVRPVETATQDYEDYLMPEGVAADLPWGGLYTAVPGVNRMRATYRWFGVARLALIVLAGLAVARLLAGGSRRGTVLVVVLGSLAVIELAPNLPLLTSRYSDNRDAVADVRATVGADLRQATRPGERAYFLTHDGHHNDYMVNYLAPHAELRAFNAGGDKNEELAREGWPAEVHALALPTVAADDVAKALEAQAVDVVIAPYFHPRLSSYSWPPGGEQVREAMLVFRPILEDRRFRVDRYPWFATVRLAP